MRWLTCTPVEFGGGPDFFARDSGLLCRGFQSIGIECHAVMPGSRKTGDEPDLIRTEYANLESAEWWRAQQADGVVLYAWGRPKYRKVAAAIRAAGVFLVLNQDNGGLVSPLAGIRDWFAEQWILSGCGRDLRAWIGFIRLTLRGLTAGLLVTDPLRAAHLKQGDVVACVSPRAAEHYRKLCRVYGGAKLVERVTVIPHAVERRFRFDGGLKQRQVVCVGRWRDQVQKRPQRLMRTASILLESDPVVRVRIIGTPGSELEDWHRGLTESFRERVSLEGMLDRESLAEALRESSVFYSPSAFESFGIAAAEALCSGCSVVAGRSVSMASFEWFTGDGSGSLANRDDAESHAGALREELKRWDSGQRDPLAMSRLWSGRLHAGNVARRILELRAGSGG